MNLYAYGLSDETGTTLAFDEGAGVGGAKPFLIEGGGVCAVVSEFADERVAVTRENLRAHNRVVGRVLAETTPLPFRFGTLVTPVRLERYVDDNREALLAALARVRGCVEMSVKIMWETEAVRREVETRVEARPSATAGPGAAYLASKRRAMAGSEALRAKADEIATWLAGVVGDAARETRVEVAPERELVVRAAHLVERVRVGEYRERLRAARVDERGRELRFLTSGAWPPYSFSEVASQKKRLP